MTAFQLTKLFTSCMSTSTPARLDSDLARVSSNETGDDLIKPLATSAEARVIAIGEYKQAALALAEAFADDDVSRYFIDTPEHAQWTQQQRWDLHLTIMEYITYAHCMRGLVTTAGENYGSVALWMPPGQNMDDMYTIFRSGLWKLNFQLCREGRNRFFSEFFPLLHDTKATVLGERDNHAWYLVYVGTRPAARGKGYARKCIDYVTQVADADGAPCYLESSNDINPKIYAKMGFVEKTQITLHRAAKPVVLDIMVREPVAGTNLFATGSEDIVEKAA